MKVLLVIPLQAYERLVSASNPAGPTYLLLKNGVLDRRGNATDCVRILASPSSAKFLLDFAAQDDSEVRASIREVAVPVYDEAFNLAMLDQPPKCFRRLRTRTKQISADQPIRHSQLFSRADLLARSVYLTGTCAREFVRKGKRSELV